MDSIDDLKFCLEMAKVAKATYAGPINQKRHSYRGEPFVGQKIIHGSFGRGYCRIFWNKNSTTIAFRGTRESVDWSIANFKAFPVRLRDCKVENRVLVHRGFQRTLDYGDKTTELRSLDAIFDYLEEFDLLEKKISITGHSMGGALALLFAVKLRSKHPEQFEENIDSIVTFAAPSAGLANFKQFYGDLADKTTRFVNGLDIVPFAPPAFFHHVGSEIWLHDDTTKADVGWVARFTVAMKNWFSGSIGDHSISEYIRKIERKISHLSGE